MLKALGFSGDDEHFEFVATDSHCIILMRTNEICTYVLSLRVPFHDGNSHAKEITRKTTFHIGNYITLHYNTHILKREPNHSHAHTPKESENEYEFV